MKAISLVRSANVSLHFELISSLNIPDELRIVGFGEAAKGNHEFKVIANDVFKNFANYACYNLAEDSSGKSKSGTCISKRGRSQLRSLLYKMTLVMVVKNKEIKEPHQYLISRDKNPLKKKQSLVMISKKIITVIYSLLKKQSTYDPVLMLGAVRREMIKEAIVKAVA